MGLIISLAIASAYAVSFAVPIVWIVRGRASLLPEALVGLAMYVVIALVGYYGVFRVAKADPFDGTRPSFSSWLLQAASYTTRAVVRRYPLVAVAPAGPPEGPH
ncbi:MAG: hypothetical protein LC722_04245 [Actinobacteria bacterium]|nr:hypothetical protein [Actinomycetota bacterium]